MKTVKTKKPIFVVGAPKTGSTSIHFALAETNLFDYPSVKDTHYLSKKNFDLASYSKYFNCNGKPIFEVDQNLAISNEAFVNIRSFFSEGVIIYVVRNQKDRFLSAYKWLLKMGGDYKSIGHAIEEEYNWMIAHGLYKENIESHILPNLSPEFKFYVVKFEDLLNENGITYRSLMKLLNIDVAPDAKLPTYNKSLAARNPIIMVTLKKILITCRFILPDHFIGFFKKSKLVEMLLFTKSKKINVDENIFCEYAEKFFDSEKYIDNLNFNKGIIRLDQNEEK